MKTRSILTSSFIAGALIFLGTGCGADTGKDNTTGLPNPSPESSISSPAAATPEENKAEVLKTAQGFYDLIQDKPVIEKLKESGAKFNGREKAPTDEELKQLVADNPEAYKYFDTSNSENIKNGYVQLIMASSVAASEANISYEVTPEAITLNSDGTATIDPSHVKVFLNDKWMNDPATTEIIEAPESSKAKVIKQDGKWLMVPFALASSPIEQ